LALKFSEIELFKKKTGEVPVLLLDDVFSELDKKRQQKILSLFPGEQTIITSSLITEEISGSTMFRVEDGKIYRL